MGNIIVNYQIHPVHPEHGLEMVDEGSRFHCDGCKMDGVGKRYTCKQRDFCLHPCCMFAENERTIKGRTYSFFDSPRPGVTKSKRKKAGFSKYDRNCDACSKTILGFVYHCPQNDEDFHPACAELLDSKLYTQDFTLKREVVSNCAECKRKLPEGAEKHIPGLSYVNEDEGEKFHFYCAMELAMERYIWKKISETGSVMELQSSSSESNNDLPQLVEETHSSLSESNEVLSSASIGTDVLLKNKSSSKISKTKRKKTSKTKKCLSILKLFVTATVSILLGDPTTIIASTVVQVVSEVLSKASG